MPDSITVPPAPQSAPSATRVGIFDSGVGGLSVLCALRAAIPGAVLHYVADSSHAPYGERDQSHVIDRSLRIASHLIDHGAQALVVACNTATAVAIESLRERWPALAIIGVEPGIKPALALSRNGRIGVMATATTLGSARFQRLLKGLGHDGDFHLQACAGLAAAIERGDLDAPALLELIELNCRPLREARVDTVVLGCTHYPLVRRQIQEALGAAVQVVDTGTAVARRAASVLGAICVATTPPDVLLETTGDSIQLQRIARDWLPFPSRVTAAPPEL